MAEKVNLKTKTLLCVDNGLFFEFCLKLADFFKDVYYYIEWKDAYPGMAKAVIGTQWEKGEQVDGFEGKNFHRIDNLYDYMDKVDAVFCPDVYDGDFQEFMREKGMPVAGAFKGEELELERWDTKQYFKKIGMDVQPTKRIVGIRPLEDYLKTVDNKWVKISKYRKQFETFHHINHRLSEPIINKLEHELGPMGLITEFIVEDNIEALVEEGFDGYTSGGKYPNYAVAGCEIKDLAYAGKFMKYTDLSKGIRRVNDQISPILKSYGYSGFFSTEVRTTKDGKNYLIDPCCRLGSPPNELYQEMYANLGEIVWGLAHGEVVDPIPTKKFGMEALIWSDWYMNSHQAFYFPKEIRRWIKTRNTVLIDGTYYTLNLHGLPEIGALVAIGDSFEECKKKLEEMAPMIEGQGLTVKVDALDEAIEEFDKMIKLSK